MLFDDDRNSTHSQISNPPVSGIKKLTLSKNEAGSFGINVVGGSDKQYIPGHNGIFVCRVRRADLDGMIKEGDRIISVNQLPLENLTHKEAVELLKRLEGPCEFVIETDAERAIVYNLDPATAGLHYSNASTTLSTNDDEEGASGFVTPNTSFGGDSTGNSHKKPGGQQQQNDMVAANSLPSSNVSNRTRNSSTSTVTYTAVQNDSRLRLGGRRIHEEDGGGDSSEPDEDDDGTTTSLAPSSSAPMDGPSASSGGTTIVQHGGAGGTINVFSQLPEILLIGVGVVTVAAIVYAGYHHFSRRS